MKNKRENYLSELFYVQIHRFISREKNNNKMLRNNRKHLDFMKCKVHYTNDDTFRIPIVWGEETYAVIGKRTHSSKVVTTTFFFTSEKFSFNVISY